MEMEQFENLTRCLGGAGSSRRQALRALGSVLLGGALGGGVARLGLVEGTEAKSKGKKRKAKSKRRPQAERKGQGQLQAEGKRKGKKHKKPKNSPPPDEPCSLDTYRCPDGTCVPWGTCCAGEKHCPNSSGPRCIPAQDCCLEEKICDDGSCASQDLCCPGNVMCPDGGCVPYWECCLGDRQCDDLTCVGPEECCPGEKRCAGQEGCFPKDQCCQGERDCEGDGSVCAKPGECCPAEQKCGEECFPKEFCCPHHKRCDDGLCIPADQCCTSLTPSCNSCSEPLCYEGWWICRGTTDAFCGYDGNDAVCCPSGSTCQAGGGGNTNTCCGLPGGCVCPIGYSSCGPGRCCRG